MDNLEQELHPRRRQYLLGWLAGQLQRYGLCPEVLWTGPNAVLRVTSYRSKTTRFVTCIPAPQIQTWVWVWSGDWALITDPRAVPAIAEAMNA
ncbi:hypothetical protein SAMN05443665_10152 [Actinomadura meyerae]|uniref:Uncharacterized protein n=1 Tax=Actinomadura meyerae TaxID=240840 RepID=A0A239JK35_9ACTN|nr:hypothetical protein [Actinomadura meyerae]SNT05104.1 hypothetical protein SAMN05443665_10152 [Actinomadura meyerae]